MTEGNVRGAENVLTQHVAVGLHQAEGRVVADRADVAEMIGKPLKFCKQRPQPDGTVRVFRESAGDRRVTVEGKINSVSDFAAFLRAALDAVK